MAASEEAHEAAEGGLDLALSLAWQGRAHCSLSAGGVSLSLSLWKGSFALSASWAYQLLSPLLLFSLSTREKRVSLRRRKLALHYRLQIQNSGDERDTEKHLKVNNIERDMCFILRIRKS